MINSTDALKILLIEGQQSDIMLIRSILSERFSHFELQGVQSKNEFDRQLTRFKPGLILSTDSVPELTAEVIIQLLKDHPVNLPWIMIAEEKKEEYLKSGADAVITKFNLLELPEAIQHVLGSRYSETVLSIEEAYLNNDNNKLKLLIERAPFCVFEIGESGEILQINTAAREFLQLRPNNLMRKARLQDFSSKADTLIINEFIRSAWKGQKQKIKIPLISSRKNSRWLSINILPVTNSKNETKGVFLFGKEIRDTAISESEIGLTISAPADLLENVEDSILSFNSNLCLEYFNKRFETDHFSLFNIRVKAGMTPDVMIPEDRFPEQYNHWNNSLKTALSGEAITIPIEYSTNLKKRFFFTTFSPIRSDNKVIGVSVIRKEVTAFREAQQKILETEERFRTLSENAPVGIFLTDAWGGCQYVNKKWKSITGLTDSESLGTGWFQCLHNEDKEKVFAEWALSVSAGRDFKMEYRMVSKQGLVFYLSGSATPIRSGDDGEITGYIGTIVDISHIKKARDKIQELDSQIRNVQAIGKIGFWESSRGIMTGSWSRYMFQLFELPFADASPDLETILSFVHPDDDREKLLKDFLSIYDDKEVLIEFRLLFNDGRIKHVLGSGYPLKDSTGKIIKALGIAMDVSELHQTRRHLLEQDAFIKRAKSLTKIGYWDFNMSNQTGNWSDEMKNIFGLSPDQSAPAFEDFIQIIHPEDRENILQFQKDLMEKQETLSLPHRIIVNGKVRRVISTAEAILEDIDEGVKLIGAVLDVTELETYKEQALTAGQNFRTIFNNAPDAMYVEDRQGNILDANEEACRVQGLNRDELIGKNLMEITPPEYRQTVRDNFEKLFDGRNDRLQTFSWSEKGKRIPIELKARKIIFEGEEALLLNVRELPVELAHGFNPEQ